MTIPVPRDQILLSEASDALDEAVTLSDSEPSVDLRLRLLEAAAAQVGGFDLAFFDQAVGNGDSANILTPAAAVDLANKLAQAVRDGPIHPSLSLAALGDSDLDPLVRRRQGRYFTDTKLALDLAGSVKERIARAKSIVDPACGAGVLLVAAVLQAGGVSGRQRHLIETVLWGVDRDRRAVRAARAAISSLTSDINAINGLCRRLLVADSLTAGHQWWKSLVAERFDLVVGNPPWEKLKVTRHEHALSSGIERHYGEDYGGVDIDEETFRSDRDIAVCYRDAVGAELVHQGRGEADLYKMFIELSAGLVSADGATALLVPAGFVRNHGATELRKWLFHNFDTDILIIDNRNRYFGIDSRFKFLQLLATRRKGEARSIQFSSSCFGDGTERWKAQTSLEELESIQPDLALPEVRGYDDWRLFVRLRRLHAEFGSLEALWCPRFHREIDMTGDKAKFKTTGNGQDSLPVVEGRMVHQHRVSAKRYVSGRGRRAQWKVQSPFNAPLGPQWFVRRGDLHPLLKDRIGWPRAGFCDITGQTNERTVLAALIPTGVVCGNKVPTIDFASKDQAAAWVGIANSFAFDWIARRLVTTTLNFFILRSLPIPKWEAKDDTYLAIAAATRLLSRLELDVGESDLWDVGNVRAKIEVMTAHLYGISIKEFEQMMCDFPQVDNAQLPLPGEVKSTVTRDLIVASGDGWATLSEVNHARERVILARSLGAVPFVPNQHARAGASYEKNARETKPDPIPTDDGSDGAKGRQRIC